MPMTPDEALADLEQISVQIRSAVICDHAGGVAAATVPAPAADRLARLASEIWESADSARRDLGRDALSQLELTTTEGSVFVVRDSDRTMLATTGANPTVGLVFYDLKSCLHALAKDASAAAIEEGPDGSS
jgi:predicted regulator of Ras-like GTPase activity (Roadblock/LC7/MglB family)